MATIFGLTPTPLRRSIAAALRVAARSFLPAGQRGADHGGRAAYAALHRDGVRRAVDLARAAFHR